MLNDFRNMTHEDLAQRALELSQKVVQLERAASKQPQTVVGLPPRVANAIVDLAFIAMRRGSISDVAKLMARHHTILTEADIKVKQLNEASAKTTTQQP